MTQHIYSRRPVNRTGIPTAVFALLIANGLVFALQQFSPRFMFINFALWPATVPQSPFGIWQLLTYAFMHGDLTHIAFNMFGLWMFGQDLERLWGPKRFLTYFLVCAVGAGVIQLLVAAVQGGLYPTVGASGGLFGILLAYGLTFPNRTVMLMFPPIPMKAKTFVIVFGVFELFMGLSGAAPGIANFAHLGGMLFGFLMLQYWRRSRH
jgi:membrane associated rhomboid family serine protease